METSIINCYNTILTLKHELSNNNPVPIYERLLHKGQETNEKIQAMRTQSSNLPYPRTKIDEKKAQETVSRLMNKQKEYDQARQDKAAALQEAVTFKPSLGDNKKETARRRSRRQSLGIGEHDVGADLYSTHKVKQAKIAKTKHALDELEEQKYLRAPKVNAYSRDLMEGKGSVMERMKQADLSSKEKRTQMKEALLKKETYSFEPDLRKGDYFGKRRMGLVCTSLILTCTSPTEHLNESTLNIEEDPPTNLTQSCPKDGLSMFLTRVTFITITRR